MTTLKPLIADAMVGQRIDDSIILAAHPDERMMPNGWEPSHTRRTLVLHFDGQRATFALELPDPLVRAWSSDSGCAYCAPVRGNYIYMFRDGRWKRETFSRKDEDVFYIWGWSGADGDSDIVFVATDGALFIRTRGSWQSHRPPRPAKRLYGLHGLHIEQLHVCSDKGLLTWNGSTFQEADDPEDATVKSILVRESDILAGEDDLLRWTEEQGWQHVAPRLPDVTALLAVGRRTFAGTFEQGVLEEVDGRFVAATPPFMCLALQRVGDAAFARGDKRGFVFAGTQWLALELPACEAGRAPRGSN